jgi:N-acyl homoserine lactone hydrolase
MRHWGETQDIPLIMFVIEGGDSPIVVDTGGDPDRVWEHHRLRMEQTPQQRPDSALLRIGIDPEEVQIVVNTHLHWDHASNNHLFPNARVVVQQRELDYAVRPVQWHNRTFETLPGVEASWKRASEQLAPVDGDVMRPERLSCRIARARPGLAGCPAHLQRRAVLFDRW